MDWRHRRSLLLLLLFSSPLSISQAISSRLCFLPFSVGSREVGRKNWKKAHLFFWNGGIRPDIFSRFSGGCDDCKIPIAKVFLLFLFFNFPIGDFCTFSPVRLRPSVSLPHRYTRKKGGCYPWPNEAAQKERKRKREEEVAMMGAPLLPLPPKGVHKAPLDSTSTSGSSFSLS